MRLVNEDTSEIVYSDVKGEAIPFSIGDTAFVIGILRDKIYSDPIYAVVAEYLSNAKDACAEIDKESDQMIVSLPTTLTPTFSIRDFGVGMSPQRISDVFVKYGVSTKRQDNSQVGCWGLGCKAAWSYSDSFIIESFFDGIHREYIADIGETKEGRLLCYKEEPTEEPNGVVIKIPVQNKDVHEFERAFIKSTMLWDKKPQLAYGRRLDYPTLVFQYKRLKFYRAPYFRDLVGKIFLNASGMPFTYNTISHSVLKSYMSLDYRFAVIEANPVKMGIAANREGFSNQEYATNLYKKTVTELMTHINDTLTAAPFEDHINVITSKFSNIKPLVHDSFYKDRWYVLCYDNNPKRLSLKAGYFLKVERNSSFLDSMSQVINVGDSDVYYLTKSLGARQYSTGCYRRASRELTPLLDPATKQAITTIKRENTLRLNRGEPTLKARILFQEKLPDSDFQEVAKILGATQYVEDVYGSRKVKISRPTQRRAPQPVHLYSKSYTKLCKWSQQGSLVDDLLTTYDAVFYATSCLSRDYDQLDYLNRFGCFNLCVVHVTTAQILQLEKLNNPKLLSFEKLDEYIKKHPNAGSLADYKAYRKSHRLWDRFLDYPEITSSKFDFEQLRKRIAFLKKLDGIHLRFDISDEESVFTKIKDTYTLLNAIESYPMQQPEIRSDLIFYINKKDEEILNA